MTTLKRFPLLAALAALLCLGPPAVASADPARYRAEVVVAAEETFTYAQEGAPDPCRSWTQASGEVSVSVSAEGPFTVRSLSRFGAYGLLGHSGADQVTVGRDVEYRQHTAAITRSCYPCGPSSEFGECEAAIPDQTGHLRCNPTEVHGHVTLTLAGPSLTAAGGAASKGPLRECGRGTPAGLPLGSPQPEPPTVTFPGAARAIARLGVGEAARFKRTTRTGPGCKAGSKELETCTRNTVEALIARVD